MSSSNHSALSDDRAGTDEIDQIAGIQKDAIIARSIGRYDTPESVTALHCIRDVRDALAAARANVRQLRVPTANRNRILEDLEKVDSELVRLYRHERFGELRNYYDPVIACETNGSRRLYLDLDSSSPLSNDE